MVVCKSEDESLTIRHTLRAPGRVVVRKSKAQNDHNVYILGAGFSAEAGFPLIKEFMNRMRDAAAWLQDQPSRTDELTAIERVLDFRLKAASASYRVPLDVENVEELFSLASATGDVSLSKAMPLAIAATLDYASSCAKPGRESNYTVGVLASLRWKTPVSWGPLPDSLRQLSQGGGAKRDWHECSPYDLYIGLMCGYFNKRGPDCQNTIITLNYDLVVEEALQHLGIEFDYGVSGSRIVRVDEERFLQTPIPETSLKLLKLHGSVNWCSAAAVSEEEVEDPNNFRLVIGKVAQLYQRIAAFDTYTELLRHRSRLTPHLVPPTWSKSLEAPLTSVLNAAVNALKTATRVIILGYSLPSTDQHFRYVLAAGLQDNISLRNIFFVNPALAKPENKASFEERLFGRLGLFRKEHEEQGVVELIPHRLREFLGNWNASDTGQNRIRICRTLNPPELQYSDEAPWRAYPNSGAGALLV
jgi:SIR2-like domain